MRRRELLEVTAVSLAKGALELRDGSQADDNMDEIAVSGLAYAAIQGASGSTADVGAVAGQEMGVHGAAGSGALPGGAQVENSGRPGSAEQQGHSEEVAVLVSTRLAAERMILSDSREAVSLLRAAGGGRKGI